MSGLQFVSLFAQRCNTQSPTVTKGRVCLVFQALIFFSHHTFVYMVTRDTDIFFYMPGEEYNVVSAWLSCLHQKTFNVGINE